MQISGGWRGNNQFVAPERGASVEQAFLCQLFSIPECHKNQKQKQKTQKKETIISFVHILSSKPFISSATIAGH